MQKRITALLTTICLIIMAASLTGCGGKTSAEESSGRAAVCYVIAPTANSQGLNFNSPLVQDTIYDTILNYGFLLKRSYTVHQYRNCPLQQVLDFHQPPLLKYKPCNEETEIL